MQSKNILRVCRFIAVGFGFITLCIGYNSHKSPAFIALLERGPHVQHLVEHLHEIHEICQVKYFSGTCPGVIMEQYYITVISLNLIFSMMAVVTFNFWYKGYANHPLKWLDISYHGLSTLLLLSAAVVYLLTALEIPNPYEKSGNAAYISRNVKKVFAGIFTILQAILSTIIAVVALKWKSIAPEEINSGCISMDAVTSEVVAMENFKSQK